MIVLGDHQPLPIVSGHNSNHDVPISIISHDPKVLKQIGSWGWNAGPAAQAQRAGVADERVPQQVPHRLRRAYGATANAVAAPDPAAMAGPRSRRLAGLDGIRGLAALYVVINHVFLRAFPGYPVDHAPFWAAWFIYGRFAVVVFIVLSGFSLALSPARHGWRLDAVPGFAHRRARRILPPYWAALAFSLAVAWLIVPQPGHGVPDAKSVLVNGLLVQNIVGAHSPNAAFWSMAVEAQLYIAFPLLLLLVRRWGGVAMVATVALIVAAVGIVGPHVAHLNMFVVQSPPDLAALFAVGIADRRDRRREPGAPVVAVAAAGARRRRAGGRVDLVAGLGVDARPSVSGSTSRSGRRIACLLAGLATGRPARLSARARHRGRCGSLGSFSYSLYLTHAPIVAIVCERIVAGRVATGVPFFLVSLALVLPLTIGFARVFASVFEIPFQRPRRASAALRPPSPSSPRRAGMRRTVCAVGVASWPPS